MKDLENHVEKSNETTGALSSTGLVDVVEAAIRAETNGSISCSAPRCSCYGDESWSCILGATPRELALAAIKAIQSKNP
jgi:hypothetical protein